MRTSQLGKLEVPSIGLGAMPMAGESYGKGNDAESIRTIHRALDLGCNFIDTAEVYGPYVGEEIVGRAIEGRREEVVLATKFGMISHTNRNGLDSSPENIRIALEGSLKRLGTDHIDLYYQHRVDPNTPIEDTVGALAEFVEQGKIRYIGLSEVWVDTVRRAHAVHPITALQSEYSLVTREQETEMLPLLRELGIGFVCYSPLGRGLLTGALRSSADLVADDWRKSNPRFMGENLERNIRIGDEVVAIAKEANATASQVALAWLLSKGDDIVPIPGTKRVSRVEENIAAADLVLTSEQIEKLNNLPQASGKHHNEEQMSMIER